jgi:hypothetical protein
MVLTSQFLSAEPISAATEKCYSLLKGEDLMQVHSNAFNLVLGRDLRRNVIYASTMAVEMAAEGKKVLYLNTYASEQLLRLSFSGVKNVEADAALESIATGSWNRKLLDDVILEQKSEVLILNSFEFTGFNRYQRDKVSRDLIELQRLHSLTVILFSHEMKPEIEARCAVRGSLAMISALAESVSKIGDEWRQTSEWHQKQLPNSPEGRIGENPVQKARVNERQTLNKVFLPRKFGGSRPNPTVDIPNDRGFSYHDGDYWCNAFDRGPYGDYTGRALSVMARTPLLQQYLLEHPDQVFMRGNTPTEAELYARQTLA